MSTRKEFHEACKTLRNKMKNMDKALSNPYGICDSLRFFYSITNSEELVKKYAKNWQHHSGNDRFPIDGSCLCFVQNSKWTGSFGTLRKDLLNYMIRNTR